MTVRRLIIKTLIVLLVVPHAAHAAQAFTQLDEARLLDSLRSYRGTPYLYGGTSRAGIDCSGLVLAVYREQGLTLPRTARQQYRVGEPVDRRSLRVGDLVFFNTKGPGVSHVGIVSGPSTFVHGSTSKGVVTDRLSSDYWRKRHIGSRRVASPSTFVVSGDRVGAAAGDRMALVSRYPFATYELVNIPTIHVTPSRSLSLQFRTNVAGDVILHPQISFWNRVQLAGYQRVGKLLGAGTPNLSWPDGLAKVRISNPWGHLPGFAVGYDTRRLRFVRETDFVGDTLITTRRRGLFLVGTGTLRHTQSWLIGRTYVHGGGSVHAFRGFEWRDDMSLFAGVEQQLLRRVILMGEIDNVRGSGGWHANLGARISITDDAVVEYSLVFVGKADTKIDKVLKFSFNLPY